MNYKAEVLEVRKQRGVSVTKLSKVTGIPSDRIYKWESGVGNPKAEDSEKLQEWLNADGTAHIKEYDLIKEMNSLMNWRVQAEETIKVLRQSVINLLTSQPGAKSAALVSAELDEAIEMAVNRRRTQNKK